jgi:phospholipid-binding lipoprotein MlaA
MVHFTRFFLNTILGMGAYRCRRDGNPQLQRLNHIVSAARLAIMASAMVVCATAILRQLYPARRRRRYGRWLYPVLSWLTWPMSIGKWAVEGIETRSAAGFRRPAAPVFRSLHYGA